MILPRDSTVSASAEARLLACAAMIITAVRKCGWPAGCSQSARPYATVGATQFATNTVLTTTGVTNPITSCATAGNPTCEIPMLAGTYFGNASSGGGFSNYWARPPYQDDAVAQ